MAQYAGPERRIIKKWSLNKEVSIGDLIAFGMAAIAIIYAYSTLDKRIAIVEQSWVVQSTVDNKQDAEAVRYQARIDQQLIAINAKLDRLIEKRQQ